MGTNSKSDNIRRMDVFQLQSSDAKQLLDVAGSFEKADSTEALARPHCFLSPTVPFSSNRSTISAAVSHTGYMNFGPRTFRPNPFSPDRKFDRNLGPVLK